LSSFLIANRWDVKQRRSTAGKATVNRPTGYVNANVAFFAPFDMTKVDGSIIRAKTVLSCLERGFRITPVVMSSSSSEPEWLTVNVPERKIVLFRRLLQTPFWVLGVVRILIKHKFDVVYVCNDWYGLGVCLLAQKVFKCKVIFEMHGIASLQSKTWGNPTVLVWLLRCWEATVLRQCDLVVAVSKRTFDFSKRYAQQVEFVPVFVDTKTFRRDEDARVALRRRYGWQGKRVVGVIGPFETKWNQDALRFLDNNLEQFDERIVFAIIGKCKHRKNWDRCFNAEFVKLQQDPGFLSCLDAVLVARKLSTSGPLTKIIEAMSFSLPVFTTPEHGMDYVEHGKDIIVANESEMARTLNSLIFDDDLMRSIGHNARQTVEKHYSYEANAPKLVHLLQEFVP
jgi:glycosyltransferase involved in cell wall biosynthesis